MRKKSDKRTAIPSSFRDPSGFLFKKKGEIYRQINQVYKPHYDQLINSRLYQTLADTQLLIPHQEIPWKPPRLKKKNSRFDQTAYKIIKPERLLFISYPYEWCFSGLKDAALTTLKIQKIALAYGMILKDASSFNIAFKNGRPILIDTLSFEKYEEGQTWLGYRQFCQHFLAPLALAAHRDIRLTMLLRNFLDGISLDLASNLLPRRTWLKFSFLSHLHLHGSFAKSNLSRLTTGKNGQAKVSRRGLIGIIDSLESAIENLSWKPEGTWKEYYEKELNYSPQAFSHKKELVKQFLAKIKPKIVWDLGANIGIFSKIAAKQKAFTVAIDSDPSTVELNYQEVKKQAETNILPLVIDITNPSPGLGWETKERMSLIQRGPADCIMALALVHHLAIGNNLPFDKIASFLAKIGKSLIIEFVPKEDKNAQRLLAARKDIFENYNQKVFEKVFGKYFVIKETVKIRDSERILYLMPRKKNF